MRSTVIAGIGPYACAYDETSSAPVGVTSSASMPGAVDGHAGQQPQRRRRRHRKGAVRDLDGAAADVQRRRDDVVDAEPLEREHGADDVDDRVERADLVQVDVVDRHVVDGRLGLAQPLEQRDRARLPRCRQRGVADQMRDLFERPMPVRVAACVVRMVAWSCE